MKLKRILCGATLAGVIAATPAWATDAKSDHHLVCVPIQEMHNSPAIDDKTILLELNGHRYKRIDLAGSCAGLMDRGFSYETSTQDLCTTNTLHVNDVAGAVCMIKDIVDISPEEAKALRKK